MGTLNQGAITFIEVEFGHAEAHCRRCDWTAGGKSKEIIRDAQTHRMAHRFEVQTCDVYGCPRPATHQMSKPDGTGSKLCDGDTDFYRVIAGNHIEFLPLTKASA